ncbi:hypothetical protein GCM10009868_39240 [Terrabacter aerolatus]|uniref:Uncharacterized protein n=1 Tax=Terrabacter aerolatus TaxID=422442 RepID=A0A512D0F4_9MICO|nr:hypothetical protein TAE01_17530 [Terrabacter aerolatus]
MNVSVVHALVRPLGNAVFTLLLRGEVRTLNARSVGTGTLGGPGGADRQPATTLERAGTVGRTAGLDTRRPSV